MPVSLNQYRGEIGSFIVNQSNHRHDYFFIKYFGKFYQKCFGLYYLVTKSVFFLMLLDQFSSCNIIYLWNFMTHLFYYRILTSFLEKFLGKFDLLMLSRDIKSNPGPRSSSGQSFSICHWNLNSIGAHCFPKISLLRAYNSVHNVSLRILS